MTRPPITHVAVRYNGVVYSAPRPARHHDLIRCICEATGADEVDATVNGGFIHPKTGGFMEGTGGALREVDRADRQAAVPAAVVFRRVVVRGARDA